MSIYLPARAHWEIETRSTVVNQMVSGDCDHMGRLLYESVVDSPLPGHLAAFPVRVFRCLAACCGG
jgi:hypothetical protein